MFTIVVLRDCRTRGTILVQELRGHLFEVTATEVAAPHVQASVAPDKVIRR